ncbi:hypothetical protein AB0N97_37950 [Streptomyces collinus]|uniref:hypothetical protein n=1 Tax=Streptomyces TaxID=1883 RepID=UPI00343BD3CC
MQRPDGTLQPFAALPYVLGRDLLRGRKPVLDKALAVLACLRCGQHFGGYTSLPGHALVDELQTLLATWTGACPTCHRDIPTPLRT